MARHLKQEEKGEAVTGVAKTSGGKARSSRTSGSQTRTGRKGKRSRRQVLSNVLIVVGIVLLAVAAFLHFKAKAEYDSQRENNQSLEAAANVTSDPTTGAPVIDWASLEAVNDDVVGWVDVEGTTMSFPVYQGKTNDTYLRHTATGEYSVGGQVFMDCENTAPGMVDQQTLIYGHHLNDGQMFAPLDDLKEQTNFDKVTTVWYVDRNGVSYELEPLLLYIIKSDYDDDLRTFNLSTEDDFHQYLNKMLAKATAMRSDAQEIIAGTSHVLTLVTCNYDFGHGRAVMLCVPKDEAAQATSGQAAG